MKMIRTALPLLLLAACATTKNEVPSGMQVGEPVVAQEVHRLADVQADPETYFNKTLLVEAEVVAVCQKMGCWIQIQDGAEKAMVRWEAGCGGKYEFPKDAAGERIVIQGSFYPKEISPEDAAHLAEEAGRDVNIPLVGYELNASAVVMVDRAGE